MRTRSVPPVPCDIRVSPSKLIAAAVVPRAPLVLLAEHALEKRHQRGQRIVGVPAPREAVAFVGGQQVHPGPERHGVLSFSSTWPAALSCTRSSDGAGRVT
jgi:hypothetical protein